jgi:hypothetical protein
MGLLGKIFEEINLRIFNYSSLSSNKSGNNELFIENALLWFKNSSSGSGQYASKYSILREQYFPPLPDAAANWISTLDNVKHNYADLYAKIFKDEKIDANITDWLLSVQRPDGTFPSSCEDLFNQPPSVFTNGRIISGLLTGYIKKKDSSVLEAIIKSAQWLVQMQMDNGSWEHYTFNEPHVNTFSAFSLIKLGKTINEQKFIEAGKKNISYTIALQKQNGYFSETNKKKINHFSIVIAQALSGILLSAGKLEDDSLIENVINGYKPFFSLLKKDGYLPGEIDDQFQTPVNYCCLEGNCLLSSIGYDLYKKTGKEFFKTTADRLLQYVKEKQLRSRYTYLSGGITGSWPISGKYNSYEIHSSAVGHYVDALIKQDSIGKD